MAAADVIDVRSGLSQRKAYMLLPQQRKFDLRVFLLWAKTEPTVVYWHPGYARACVDKWQPIVADGSEVNKFAHLTNLAVAKVRCVANM